MRSMQETQTRRRRDDENERRMIGKGTRAPYEEGQAHRVLKKLALQRRYSRTRTYAPARILLRTSFLSFCTWARRALRTCALYDACREEGAIMRRCQARDQGRRLDTRRHAHRDKQSFQIRSDQVEGVQCEYPKRKKKKSTWTRSICSPETFSNMGKKRR